MPPVFWRKLFKLFSFNIYSLFFIQCVSSHIFWVLRDMILGVFKREHKRGRDRESNLRVNYDPANNTQKKFVSWNRCSLKTSKILKKFIWRSSSLIKQQVESLQVYLKTNFLIGNFQELCTNQNLTTLNFGNLITALFKKHIYAPVSGYKHYAIETKEN